jgi:uncharacterized membrane protein YgcG
MRYLAGLFLLWLLIVPVTAQDFLLPERQGIVTDTVGVIDADTRQKIETLAKDLKHSTNFDLNLVIIRTTMPSDPLTYGQALYDRWDVGEKKRGLDNGILLLIALMDREVKIINGTKVDSILLPQVKENIELGFFPFLGKGQFAEAAYYGTASIVKYLLDETPKNQAGQRLGDSRAVSLIFFALVIAAVLLTLAFEGTWLTIFSTVIGGLFGYFIVGTLGVFIGSGLGFLLNKWGTNEQIETEAQKEFRILYDQWKEKRNRAKEKH